MCWRWREGQSGVLENHFNRTTVRYIQRDLFFKKWAEKSRVVKRRTYGKLRMQLTIRNGERDVFGAREGGSVEQIEYVSTSNDTGGLLNGNVVRDGTAVTNARADVITNEKRTNRKTGNRRIMPGGDELTKAGQHNDGEEDDGW